MTVTVDLGARGYDVHVAAGARSMVGDVLADVTRADRVLVLTQQPVARHWLDDVTDALREADVQVRVHTIPDGEAHKNIDTVVAAWDACADFELSRRDAIVALGGGVVTDLAGFVAATYNRGVPIVQVPSTLLAQVDAAIGGKTGIDLATGKNLVGAIHQPAAVVCDTDLLTTLAPRVRREGFGEVVKHALLADATMLAALESGGDAWLAPDGDLTGLVEANVAIKAAVVGSDERELGHRAHLNLGHTYGHVLELLVGLGQWWHGEAVAAGLLVALALGEVTGRHSSDLRTRVTAILGQLGLPTAAPVLDRDAAFAVMRRDKKADTRIHWVVLDDIGHPTLTTPTLDEVDRAIGLVERDGFTWPDDRSDDRQGHT